LQSRGGCPEGQSDAAARGSVDVEGVVMESTSDAIERLLLVLDLDEAGLANAAIVRALAAKLDEARHSESGAAAMAMPGIAKELRAVIDEICESASDRQSFVSDLFS
jgi:hypothetical protein